MQNPIWIPKYKVESFVHILAEVLDYNHKLMNVPAMWNLTRGKGVKVVVIDTGCPKHTDIIMSGYRSAIAGDDGMDRDGHSTHCCGIIGATAGNGMGVAGIAPEVSLYSIKALGDDGSGSIADIAKAVRMATDEFGADIISMSIGCTSNMLFRELESACNYAVSQGSTICCAAGNEAGDVTQPGSYDSVMCVAAVDSKEQHANFSNYGPQVDFAAGGVNVYSTYLKNGYATLSGTSMATPAFAAMCALVISAHKSKGDKLTPEDVRLHMKKIAYDVGPKGFDDLYGNGIPLFHNGDDPDADDPAPRPDQPEDPVPTPTPTPVTPQPVLPPIPMKKGAANAAVAGIEPNCVYWRLWNEFIGPVETNLMDGGNVASALRKGLLALAAETKAINRLIGK